MFEIILASLCQVMKKRKLVAKPVLQQTGQWERDRPHRQELSQTALTQTPHRTQNPQGRDDSAFSGTSVGN